MATAVPQFKENILGRLGNFPLSVEKPLYPLFEAISNLLHAIDDSGRTDGQIVVQIHREPSKTAPLSPEIRVSEDVNGFTITDNGIGFTDENFTSFCTADSMFKKSPGGKGVGRLSWLKVFDKAEIESTYRDSKGKMRRRQFTFTLTDPPIGGYTDDVDADEKETESHCQTVIRLLGMKPDYKAHCFKQYDTIARKIIEHFLTLFVHDTCPEITLLDLDTCNDQTLNRIFQNDIGQHSVVEQIEVGGQEFKIQHFRMATRSPSPPHNLHFCARDRSVETRDLARILPNLKGPLHDDSTGHFAYSGYVSGDLLDETVNQERTRLDLLHEGSLFEKDEEEPTREVLIKELADRSEAFLEQYLTPINESKLVWIKNYIRSRPLFRPILKLRPEWIKDIPVGISDAELDIELYKLVHRLEIEVRKEGARLREEPQPTTATSVADHKRKFERFLEESNSVGFAKLADYVVHRRAVIEFLSECMKRQQNGRYSLEEVVHDVIFPMKSTSNDVPDPDQSNLWMIDERLAYHYYLSSDTEFRGTEEIKVKKEHERERVDLLVLQPYDRPHAFVGVNNQPFDSVTIIEFKRPNRDDYSENDEERDPIAQVWRYAEKIQTGTIKDKSGQYVKTNDGTQFYAYIVCNLSPKMIDLAKFHSFIPMPDNLGYFAWQPNYRVYTEILDYQKLIQDAKKRNQVFFDKFNLPPVV
jgi:hypothetical protein